MITREQIIEHILNIKKQDEVYALWALARYNMLMPWLNLNDGIREAMKKEKA